MNETTPSLDDARLFVSVAELLSFGEAARKLGVPTSTVSRRVAALESSLETRLLQRTSRKVSLTPDGARLLQRLRGSLDEITQALDGARDRDDQPSGRLRVTAPVISGTERIAPALMAFAKRYPRITVELRLTNAVLDIIGEGYDLAFRERPVHDSELVAKKVFTYEYALVASQKFVTTALNGETRLDRGMLESLPGIVHTSGRGWRFKRRNGAEVVIHPRERFVVDEPRVAAAAAAEGLGVACVTTSVAVAEKRLLELTVSGLTTAPRELYAVFPGRRLLATRVRLAIDWFTKKDARL